MSEIQVLYNMSCRPNATIRRAPQVVGRLAAISLPLALPVDPAQHAATWLGALGLEVPDGLAARHAALRRVLDAAVVRSALPPMAPVVEVPGEEIRGLSDELDVVLAVLAKSSGGVFVARADAVVERIARRPSLSLVLPDTWRPQR